VFVPTIFIPGITGRLYQQFAATIAISVLLSAFKCADAESRACQSSPQTSLRGSQPAATVLRLVQPRF
jgi:hypothetical protein